MNTIHITTVQDKMRQLGLEFMAESLESLLDHESTRENTLLESFDSLIETELIPRVERLRKTRIKL